MRVHGNATLTDEAVLNLAGVSAGATLEAGGVEAIEKRLRDSGRFDEVQVRKRYRTLAMDENTGRIFMPTARFGPAAAGGGSAPILPQTFTLLVAGP